jgi:hypothetical protein
VGQVAVRLVDAELARIDWKTVREAAGSASDVPDALLALLAVENAKDVQAQYWRLENHVVVQGQVFEAGLLLVPALLAGLTESSPSYVRIGLLELLFQIVNGTPHEDEIALGNTDLVERCRDRAREGLWLLYRELVSGQYEAAFEVLEVIERDRDRLSRVSRPG